MAKMKTAKTRPATRRPRAPAHERLAELDERLAAARARAERVLIRAAAKAGLFGLKVSEAEVASLLREGLAARGLTAESSLAKLETRRSALAGRIAKDARRDEARRRAILGEFLADRFMRDPLLHASCLSELRTWLGAHPTPSVAAANIALMEPFLTPAAGRPLDPGAAGEPPTVAQARRDQARRRILLGAWLLARRHDRPELERLLAQDLPQFLDRQPGARARRSRELLADMLEGGRPSR